LLGRDPATPFEVTDSITVTYSPDKDELLHIAGQSNIAIQAYRKQVDIARLSLQEYQRSFLPMLNLRAGYYLSGSNNPYGTVLNSRNYGPGISGTISIPIYSAGENRRQVEGARIRLNSAGYNLQDITLLVNTRLLNAWTNFQNQKRLLEIETELPPLKFTRRRMILSGRTPACLVFHTALNLPRPGSNKSLQRWGRRGIESFKV
jgi:outer membrane protein TolC